MELDFDNVVHTLPLRITDIKPKPLWQKPPVETMRLRDIQSVNNFLMQYEERITAVLSFLVSGGEDVEYRIAHIFTPVPQDPQNSFYQNWIIFSYLEDNIRIEKTVGLISTLRTPNSTFLTLFNRNPEPKWVDTIPPPIIEDNPVHPTYKDKDGISLSVGLPEDYYPVGHIWVDTEGISWQKELASSHFTVYHRWKKID